MPKKALRPCRHSGCPNLTDGLYCTEHRPMHHGRLSASKRGYGSKWQKVSRAYLRRNPLCVRCLANGRYIQATVTDHIIPHRNRPELLWNENNFQALCKPCHDRKTLTEDINPEYTY